ncbi:zinc finger CCCH domain-containing protein 62 isoform X2 [Cynara cardunculus var. scolymus]|uniref:zinc finger CCCH domain-containing protein 62 isoform X2 n=1 Tax=Cynara cardunculus var. scolymus TaxID=59895 RepID=UPI000D62B110|nr:zinc finger CCCH domain-containing protein 62 isoform X2 [Cynara cardunculus var. scolymus]
MKPPVIYISSSSDDDDDDDEGNFDDEEELESDFSPTDDGDDSESDDQDYDVEEENDSKSDEEDCFDNRDEISNRVVSFHQGSNDVKEPSLDECKAYLRKHGLRLSGTKEECIQRIKEHGRFDKASRRGDVVGKRTVAGKIVKESYGASKQQHTFTIEVLWSKGPKKLPPLTPLLVKGRNLYRFRTLRQPWKSEAARSKVLGEKHKRGEAARHKRKLKKTQIAFENEEGRKRQKVSDRRPSTRTDKYESGQKRVNERNAVRFQKRESKTSQTTFGADPNRCVYSDHHHHHLQQASSSSIPNHPISNLPPLGFPGYHGHYYNGEPLLRNHVLYRPMGYNYEQPFPRYRFG